MKALPSEVVFADDSSLLIHQGAAPGDLPPWMKFLHGKLANPSTPLNIRLFVSKLIINTEEVGAGEDPEESGGLVNNF